MTRGLRYEPTWADVIEEHAAVEATGRRLVAQLRACEVAALAFCRLLERWARGDGLPGARGARPGARRAERRGPGRRDPAARLALGGVVRPAREPARAGR